MEFDLSNDQRDLITQVDRFLTDEMPADRLHKAFDGDAELFRAMSQGLLDLGLGGVTIPEEHGGLGLQLLEAASISERLGFAGAPGPWIGHTLAGYAIARAGSAEQQAKWLPRLAAGEIVGGVALMERDAWRPQDWTLAAEGRVTGGKDYVTGLDEAAVIVVGLAGGKLGLVELNAPGVTATPWSSTDKTRPVGHLALDNASVEVMPEVFGEQLLNAALVLIAADAHGGCMRMRDDITEYSKTRKQYDRTIASFQAVKHKLAELALHIEYNGALYRQAAAVCDQEPQNANFAASNAKAHITDTFATSARIATESYGGIGYTWEHTAHIWLRRALFNFAWMGQPMAHRRRVTAELGW